MKRNLLIFILALVLMLSLPVGVSANDTGNNPKHLSEKGWTCFNVPGLGVHCAPPGVDMFSPDLKQKAVSVLYFDTNNPADAEAAFLGTELLISKDVYNGQPCPQEGLDEYHNLGEFYACHHR
jgi:hypothetical protein